MGKYFRNPKTTSEKKANLTSKNEFDDFKVKVCRGKRNSKNLPNVRDDIWKNHERSWKKFRKNKFKG